MIFGPALTKWACRRQSSRARLMVIGGGGGGAAAPLVADEEALECVDFAEAVEMKLRLHVSYVKSQHM